MKQVPEQFREAHVHGERSGQVDSRFSECEVRFFTWASRVLTRRQFIAARMREADIWSQASDTEFDNAMEGMEKLVMNRLYD